MSANQQDKRLDRRDVTRRLLADRGDLLVIGGLGGTAWDITSTGDHALNFPLWGGMGNAAMIGLGLAMAQPDKRVLVITGDGEMLMGLGGLATIGTQQPENLVVVVFDNELYGETGRRTRLTARTLQQWHGEPGSTIPGLRTRWMMWTTLQWQSGAKPGFCSHRSRSQTIRVRSCCRRGMVPI